MKFIDAIFSGSIFISGSFTPPKGTKDQRPTNPVTASVFFETSTSGSRLLIYNGSGSEGWQEVGLQSDPVSPPPPIASADIEYLVVAGGGGGGGGGWGAGGGGAGGMLSSSISSVESGSIFTINVGAGGAGRGGGNTFTAGGNGVTSSIAGATITTIEATGGGGGGAENDNSGLGLNGGSGGGSTTGNASGGSGTVGQGNDGGAGTGFSAPGYPGGGGGGKGSAGSTPSGNTAGDGGDGQASSITGTSLFYAGGGGGGTRTAGAGGTGGSSVGGNGAAGGTAATSATVNRGAGGGGAEGSANASNGSSGVVILAYPTASISATGGVRTFVNDRVAHTFNSSGTFTVGGTKTYTHNTLDVFGDSSCIALYTLDGNANDTSGNYNGTTSNVTYSQGYINNGGVFNGSSSKLNTGIVLASTTFSVSVWFNTTVSGKSIIATLNSSAGSVNDRDGFYILSQFYSIFNNDVQIVAGTYNAGDLNDGNWHHIVLTNDGSNSKLYIDGSLDRTDSSSGWNTLGSQDIHLGFIQRSPIVNWFDGKIDQVRVFNKALTSSEVTTLYNE